MLDIGLLGAGRIEQVHAKAISSHLGSRLLAVSDVNVGAADNPAAAHGADALGTGAILADGKIDAAPIASSMNTHSERIEAATKADKAALCVKPVDLSLTPVLACQSVAAETGRPVIIGFNRRFDLNFKSFKAAVVASVIGLWRASLIAQIWIEAGAPIEFSSLDLGRKSIRPFGLSHG